MGSGGGRFGCAGSKVRKQYELANCSSVGEGEGRGGVVPSSVFV